MSRGTYLLRMVLRNLPYSGKKVGTLMFRAGGPPLFNYRSTSYRLPPQSSSFSPSLVPLIPYHSHHFAFRGTVLPPTKKESRNYQSEIVACRNPCFVIKVVGCGCFLITMNWQILINALSVLSVTKRRKVISLVHVPEPVSLEGDPIVHSPDPSVKHCERGSGRLGVCRMCAPAMHRDLKVIPRNLICMLKVVSSSKP